ncbi:hypothetical protein [Chitinophaga japonensis]|uniref:Uncharacterized protein n=1 Tax=Chitinophaga japonensis TaxID=104662 RepID=A0A562SM19_CHIJA|nr:hypothetical protein [Chitinophaga japonensis]TWI81984.1 hypothetical protein LX66_5300 [Chitinophaga japonensis]
MENKTTITSPDVIYQDKGLQPSAKARVKALSAPERDEAFDKLFNHLTDDDEGREVEIADAMECIDCYNAEMKKRGILHPSDIFIPPVTVNDRLDITHFVKFNGFKLKEWILEQYYGPAEQDVVHFKLANGIYTDTFLGIYFASAPASIEARRNRITTFIIPFFKDPAKAVLNGGKAYNLGGLEP